MALASHAARLGTAQAEFDTARQLADEALAQERAHHAAAAEAPVPGSSFGDLLWRSPLRAAARLRAEQAVAEAAESARQAAAALQELTAPLTVPAPARDEGHWYDQATGFARGVWDGVTEPVAVGAGLVGLNGDAGENWAALGSGLTHAVTNPGDFAKAVVGWEDLSQGNYGHWAGELAPSVVAAFFTGGAAAGLKGADAVAAATRAGAAASTAAGVAKSLPGALKDVRVLITETPDGLRLPAGLDTTSLRTLMSEAREGNADRSVAGPASDNASQPAGSSAPAVHPGKQAKHVVGAHGFIPGRSELTAEPESLARHAGTGDPVGRVERGQVGFKERVDFGFEIGVFVDKAGNRRPTTIGIIHYAADGSIHIVPGRPTP